MRSRCGRSGSAPRPRRPQGWWLGLRTGPSGPGRWKVPVGWVTCWPSSWLRPGSGCWTSSPSWAPGCGCWPPGRAARTTPNDARSVAIAALRPKTAAEVAVAGHAAVLKVWSKRHRDLGRAPNQLACRLHAVLCDLVPGGFGKEITAGQAFGLLERIRPSGAVAQARYGLAAEFIEDLRRLDAQLRDTRNKLTAAVKASGTSLTGIFGAGPVIAATVIGATGQVSRFASRGRFAAYNGTAPIEVSSGNRRIYRLSRRGNRRVNHAIHMAAVTQIRNKHSEGRAYFDHKLAEGKTRKEAPRSLKRHVSNAVYARLQDDARRTRRAAI